MKIETSNEEITRKQYNYIEILVIDLCFTRRERNHHFNTITGRQISFIDDLTKAEASKIISTFKKWKETKEWKNVSTELKEEESDN